MKQTVFTFFFISTFLIFSSGEVYSQTWKDAYDKGKELLKKAETTGKDLRNLTENEHLERQRLFKEAADNFITVRDNNRRLAPEAVYYIAYALRNVSKEQSALGKDADAYETMRQALQFWPELDVVPAQRFTDDLTIRFKGEKLIFGTIGSTEIWQQEFYSNYLRAMQLANKLQRFEEAKEYGLFVITEADTFPRESFIALAEMVDVYKNTENPCRAIDYAMRALRKAQEFHSFTSTDKQMVSEYLKKLAIEVAPQKNCTNNTSRAAEEAALALAALNEKEDLSFFVLLYGNDAYEGGRKGNELLIALAEAENRQKAANSDLPKTNYFETLEANKSKLTSYELLRLGKLYELRGNTAEKEVLQQKAKRRAYWENTHFALSTNPFNIYWEQYLMAFEVMLPRTSHELRFNYHTDSRHLLWKYTGDTTPGNSQLYYKGFTTSYTFKFTTHNAYRKNYFYHGPQIRYDMRDYNPVISAVAPHINRENKSFTEVDGISHRFDLTYMLGSQVRGKYLFFDYFVGVGVGYKTMNTNIDEDTFIILDDRFKRERWDNIYVPVRAGWRIGFIIK